MSQRAFTEALLDPERAVPEGLTGPAGAPIGNRFDIYRNNVAVGLTEALIAAYPVVHRLVGDDFFRAVAGVYFRQQPPRSRLMKDFGDTFPRFLAHFPPAKQLAYLPDVARLERARVHAFHAADTPPLNATGLEGSDPARLLASRVRLTPAATLIASPHPILAIWRANMEGGPKPLPGPCEIVVARRGFDPVMAELPPHGAAFATELKRGRTLAAAHATAPRGFDLAATLAALAAAGAIAALEEPT